MDKIDDSVFSEHLWTEVQSLRKQLSNESSSLPAGFLDLIKDSCLLEDWQWWKERVLAENDEKELFWLLSISRNIGLIEFEKLRQLRKMKIRVLGASVAAMTIDLLASLGCEDIICIDPGVLEVSNLPRLPHATVEDLGVSKAEVLVRQLNKRNPFGNYRGIHGKVIVDEGERTSVNDQVLQDFVADADLVIEVIDDIRMKILTQQLFIEHKKETPLLFIADVGNQPIVKFISAWTMEQQRIYAEFLAAFNQSNRHAQQLAAQSIFIMVKDNLPPEHAAQFLLSCYGVIPYWSQTPIASRLSAGLAVAEILKILPAQKKLYLESKKTSLFYEQFVELR